VGRSVRGIRGAAIRAIESSEMATTQPGGCGPNASCGGMVSRLVPPPAFCDPQDSSCCNETEPRKHARVRSSCEACSVAKVRCSGEIPCERCDKKKLHCEYQLERKRGRRTVTTEAKKTCSNESCWGQVIMNPVNKCEDFGARFGLASVERRLFQTFFTIYKHHATSQSCCKEWFTYQLNKMSTFLSANGNKEGQEKLDAWMRKKNIEVRPHDPRHYCKVPGQIVDDKTGQPIPPIHPLRGPKMRLKDTTREKKRKRNQNRAVYSNSGLYVEGMKNSAADRHIEKLKSMCFLNLRSTHESFSVEVNEEFTALFGHTSSDIIILMERLFGGLLPWGCDILAMLLTSDHDLLFFMRMLAMKFNLIGRPAALPATRQVFSMQVFEFETKGGDIVECMLHCIHREFLSLDRTEVDIYFGLEPTIPDVPRNFRHLTTQNGHRMMSRPGQDSTAPKRVKNEQLVQDPMLTPQTNGVPNQYFEAQPQHVAMQQEPAILMSQHSSPGINQLRPDIKLDYGLGESALPLGDPVLAPQQQPNYQTPDAVYRSVSGVSGHSSGSSYHSEVPRSGLLPSAMRQSSGSSFGGSEGTRGGDSPPGDQDPFPDTDREGLDFLDSIFDWVGSENGPYDAPTSIPQGKSLLPSERQKPIDVWVSPYKEVSETRSGPTTANNERSADVSDLYRPLSSATL